jgi:GxxExxY protein
MTQLTALDGTPWKHADLTGRILGCAIEVSNELGVGFLESVYHNALVFALTSAGLSVETQKPMLVTFRGLTVGRYYADMVVDNKIIVELKVARILAPEHSAQVLNYLKAAQIEVGLLLNFGTSKMDYRRLVMSAALS